jgi:hypothetical protein
MRDCTAMCNTAGKQVATIGFNDAYGLWQIVVWSARTLEFFCPTKELAFAAWKDKFDPDTEFPRSFETSRLDA